MQDELWMRNWNDAQPRFSADVDRGAARLTALVRRIAARMVRPGTARQTGPAAR